jgi:hypothetical protein
MKLSIIPSDGTVCLNGNCFTHLSWEDTPPNIHALQWDVTKGWLEFNDGKGNEPITELPVWVANALTAWNAAASPQPRSAPTPQEIQAQNKAQAKSLLAETNWAVLPDVTDDTINPHLANPKEFITYRESIRKIAVSPPDFVIEHWPTKPQAKWVSAKNPDNSKSGRP